MMRYLIITIVVLILDQLSKGWIISNLQLGDYFPIIPGVFNINHACNYGAAFSFLSDAGGWQRWAISIFVMFVSLFILVWLIKLPKDKSLLAVALAMILGGALGNLADRIFIGCVVDFIQVYISFIPFRIFNPWPSFNIADSAVFIGAILYIIDSIYEQKAEHQ